MGFPGRWWGNQNLQQVNLEHLKDPHGSIGNSMHIPNVGAVMKKEKIKEAQTTGNYDDYDEFQPFYQWEISRIQYMEVRFKVPYFRPYVVGIFPFQSNLGSWRSPIDSMLLRREDWTPWNSWVSVAWRQGDPRRYHQGGVHEASHGWERSGLIRRFLRCCSSPHLDKFGG